MAETEVKIINGRTLCDTTARKAAKKAQETADAITVPTKTSEIENDSGFFSGEDIVDNLTSDASDKPLSAAQGAVLKRDLDDVKYVPVSQEGAWDYRGLPETDHVKRLTFPETSDDPFAGSRFVLHGKNFFPDSSRFNKTSPLNGITFEQTGRMMHISGTASAAATFYVMDGDSLDIKLPDDVTGGDTICVRTITAGTLFKYILLQFAFYDENNNKLTAFNHDFSTSADKTTTVTLPDGADHFRVNYSVKSNDQTQTHDRYIVAAMYKSDAKISQDTDVAGSVSDISLFPSPAERIDFSVNTKTYVDMKIGEGSSLTPDSLGYLTPEMYGAAGDNYNDDTAAINQCLEDGVTNNLPVRMARRYRISSPLYIGSGADVYINKLNYTGTDAAVIMDCEKSRVDIRTIQSGGIGVRLTAETVIVTANDLTLGTVRSQSHCISLETPVKALYGNRIRFMQLTAGGDGCYCITNKANENNVEYLTENTFTGGHCSNADWAWYGSGGNSKFYDIQVEDKIKGGFCFVNGCQALIIGDRHAESQRDGEFPYLKITDTGKTMQQSSVTSLEYISPLYLGINEIDVSGVSTRLSNGSLVSSYGGIGKIHCPIGRYVVTGSNDSKHYQLFGRSATLWGNTIILQEVPYKYYTVTENLDLRTITEDTPAMPSVFEIGCENCEIYLHPTYCFMGIQRFEVIQTDVFKAKIYDYYKNSLIFDGDSWGAGTFEVSTYLYGDYALIDGTNMIWKVRKKLNSGSSVDTVTVNEINEMIVEYFESKTVSEVEA